MIAESASKTDKPPYAVALKAQYQMSHGTFMANILPPATWTPPHNLPTLATSTTSDAPPFHSIKEKSSLQEDKPDSTKKLPHKSPKEDELVAASESSTALPQPSTAPPPYD